MEPTPTPKPRSESQASGALARTSSALIRAADAALGTPPHTPSPQTDTSVSQVLGRTPVKGIDYWVPGRGRWYTDQNRISPCSMELLLDIFHDQPDLWQRYKAGKNGQKATYLKNFLASELERRFCPTLRKPETIAAQIASHLVKFKAARDESERTGLGAGGFMMANGAKVVPRDEREIDAVLEQICPFYHRTMQVMGGSAGARRSTISDNVSGNAVISNSLASQVSTIGRPSQTQETVGSETEESDSDAEANAETPVPKTIRSKNLAGKRKRPSHTSPIASSILETLMDRQEKADKIKAAEELSIARERNDIERERVAADLKRAKTDDKRAQLDLLRFEAERHVAAATTWEKSHDILGKWYDRISASHPSASPAECFKMAQDVVNMNPLPHQESDSRSEASSASQPRRERRRRSPTPEGANLQLSSPIHKSF